jgi:hypothetical protein
MPPELPSDVRTALNKALTCASRGDTKDELTHFIHAHPLLARVISGHDFEVTESIARALA